MDNSSDDIKIVKYILILEKVKKTNNQFKLQYKKFNEVIKNSKYIYENNFDIYNHLTDKEEYISQNNIIVYYINDDISKYLYDKLISDYLYNNINELNEQLSIQTIDYNEINNIIDEHIENVISTEINPVLNKLNIAIQNSNIFYFYLKYNKSTYYSDELINYIINNIINKLKAKFNIDDQFNINQ